MEWAVQTGRRANRQRMKRTAGRAGKEQSMQWDSHDSEGTDPETGPNEADRGLSRIVGRTAPAGHTRLSLYGVAEDAPQAG